MSAGQPLTWTFIEVNAEDQVLTDLVEALSHSLDPKGGWYCSFHTLEKTFVVLAGRVFRYPSGDVQGRAEAEAYGRSVGVPEAQLDRYVRLKGGLDVKVTGSPSDLEGEDASSSAHAAGHAEMESILSSSC